MILVKSQRPTPLNKKCGSKEKITGASVQLARNADSNSNQNYPSFLRLVIYLRRNVVGGED